MKTTKFKPSEVGPIPEEWEVVSLGDLFTFKNGYNAPAACYGAGTPVASVLEALDRVPLTNSRIRTKVKAPRSAQSMFSLMDGDLIFTRSSETLEDVGRTNVYMDEVPSMFGGFVIRGRPRTQNSSRFVNYLLKDQKHRERVMAKGAGAQHYNIGQAGLSNVIITLPPRPEQERIAEALSDVDALLAAMTLLIEKKRAIKQGTMQQLLTGKKRLAGFTGEWVEKRLGEVCEINPSGGNIQDQFVYIDLESVSGGRLLARNVVDRSSAPSRAQRCFACKDILFQTVRPYQKNNLYVDFEASDYVASTGYAVLRELTGKSSSRFLYYVIHTEGFVSEVLDRCVGTSYPAINPGKLAELIIGLPKDLTEQQAIAAVLSDMDAEIAALEAKRAKYESVKQGMMQELLTGKVRLV